MTAFLEGLVRDVLYAFRAFRRAPLAALTVVATVGLGLGLVTLVFSILNVFLFRVDKVRNPGEMFAVERPRLPNGDAVRFTRPQFEALRRETAVFSDAFAMLQDIDLRIDGQMMSNTLVTGNFFQVLGVGAARGRALAPADDLPGGQAVVVLSHRGWTRRFANDPNVVGRRVLVSGVSFEIVGVMPDGFRGLAVGAPDVWAPLAQLVQFRPSHAGHEDLVGLDIVGRLKPGLSRREALAGLVVWDSGPTNTSRTSNLTLEPRQGTIPQPMEGLLLFTPLFFAFGLILMIGCANVANLLLARGVSRQREIGIRLSLGASRARVTRQLLTESLLLALAAAASGFAISRLATEVLVAAVLTTMPPDLGDISLGIPPTDWRVVLFLVGGAIVSTVFFGLAPALQATRIELVRTIRGEVTRDARPGRARQLLIGGQVTASALLLICSAVFLRSAMASATIDPGIRTSDTVIVEINNEKMRDQMLRAVRAEPYVAAVAATWPDLMAPPREAFAQAVQGTKPSKANVAYKFVSPEYFSVLGVDIVQGRGFTSAERAADAGVLVVSESVARQLWAGGNAVGQVMQLEPDPKSESRRTDYEPPLQLRSFTVVGVARDVVGFRMAPFDEAGVYVPGDHTLAKSGLTLQVRGDPELARQALLKRLTLVDPNMGLVITLRTVARAETYLLQVAFWLTLVLGVLALVLTVSGLFSVLSYLIEQRAKEIGVRMALGATTRDVSRLVLSQSIRPVGIGLTIGSGLALALGIVLMATPAAAQIGEIVHVFDPIAYAGSLLCIVMACAAAALVPALRAARIDPVNTLRQD